MKWFHVQNLCKGSCQLPGLCLVPCFPSSLTKHNSIHKKLTCSLFHYSPLLPNQLTALLKSKETDNSVVTIMVNFWWLKRNPYLLQYLTEYLFNTIFKGKKIKAFGETKFGKFVFSITRCICFRRPSYFRLFKLRNNLSNNNLLICMIWKNRRR